MPCSSSHFDGPDLGSTSHDVHKLKAEADKTTRMLCSVLRAMEAAGILPDDPELREWYAEHREHDRAQGRP